MNMDLFWHKLASAASFTFAKKDTDKFNRIYEKDFYEFIMDDCPWKNKIYCIIYIA